MSAWLKNFKIVCNKCNSNSLQVKGVGFGVVQIKCLMCGNSEDLGK